MIPLIPTLALAFLSFISSAFVILRIVIPILPPHPLSRRVPPSEFGLPNFRTLSPADKSHIWLASLDLLALAVFLWQAVMEALGGPADFADALDPGSSARLWFSMTIRQVCLLVVASLTLLHVRMGRSVSFGAKHWMLWTPTALIGITSTTLCGVLAASRVPSFFPGLVAFSSTIAIASTVAFACLITTLIIIRRNLAALNDPSDPWPPVREVEEKPRPSFGTEDVDAMRDGSSWITSNASSSRPGSVSGWSFSTHHTAHQHRRSGSGRTHTYTNPATGSYPSIPAKSSFWFNPATPYGTSRDSTIPPVPPLPSPYRPPSPTAATLSDDPDPFRRDVPGESSPRPRMGSQASWLTSSAGSQTTLSAWSYPTTHHDSAGVMRPSASTHELLPSTARPMTPAMANAQVLGGYGYAPGSVEAEKGALVSLAVPENGSIDVSIYRAIGWLITIWVPLALSLPYLFTVTPGNPAPSPLTPILLVLSVTLSSPLLALNIIFRSPLPIPSGLFDGPSDPPSNVLRAPSPQSSSSLAGSFMHEYKRSGSVTVVEGRRSGDVWVSNGDAVDGKSKYGRAMGLLSPNPRLAVLPPGEELEDGELTPPLPIQMEETPVPLTPQQSEISAELGRVRKESKASSHFSGGSESLAYASRIMVAQRHYSALATTVVVPASPEKDEAAAAATGAAIAGQGSKTPGTHLRSRSITSFSGPRSPSMMGSPSISPPPSFPLPPTPPNVKASRLAKLGHKKSFSSGFSFGAVGNDDMNEIDALTAGVLPLLVPGLKVGHEMRIRGSLADVSPPETRRSKGSKVSSSSEFGGLSEFSSPQVHSTPARTRQAATMARQRKTSGHKRNHFSLPSLGLGKDGVHSLATWKAEVSRALENKAGQDAAISNNDVARRNTVWGGESVPNTASHLNAVREEDELRPISSGAPRGAKLGRAMSTRTLGLQADVPTGVSTARSSVATLLSEVGHMIPPSAASTVTLFELEGCGPDAESTPHNSLKGHNKRNSAQPAPPLPLTNNITERPANRRSSIVYIKSDDENSPPNPAPMSASRTFAQWSSRAVRPLMPRASKLQRKMSSSAENNNSNSKLGSPSGGLRPLSLLQDRDTNAALPASPGGTTRPLVLGKKQKSKRPDENANINVAADPSSKNRNHNLKPLQLTRSETSKLRGILRKEEVLPDVVVRPPSQTEHTGFGYNFH